MYLKRVHLSRHKRLMCINTWECNAGCVALRQGEKSAEGKELRADHKDHDNDEDGAASAEEGIGDCRRCQASI